MKIRNGFVSNSSSSSFVIAIKNDNVSKNIDEWLEANKEDVERFLEENGEYLDSATWEEFVDEAKGELVYYSGGLKLDEWTVSSRECGSEDGESLSGYIYDGSNDTDNIKIASFD